MPTDAAPKPKAKAAADPAGAPLIIDPGVLNPFPNGDRAPKPAPPNPGTPGGAAPRKRGARKKAVTDAQIREALSEILCAPGVPFSMMRMDWAADHVFRTGPEFADAMVAYSLTNKWLREQLEKVARGDNAIGALIAVFGVLTAGANYLVPLLAYFGVIPLSLGEKVKGSPIPPNPTHATPEDTFPS